MAPVFRGRGPGDPLLEVGLTALLALTQGPQGQAGGTMWPEPCPGWDAEVPFWEASVSGEMLTSDQEDTAFLMCLCGGTLTTEKEPRFFLTSTLPGSHLIYRLVLGGLSSEHSWEEKEA